MKSPLNLLGRRTPQSPQKTGVQTADHIARALSAAGLDRAGGGALRHTIDRALADAGLLRDDASAPAHPASSPYQPAAQRAVAPQTPGRGQILHASYANVHGRRDYRLYLPADYRADGEPQPLIMMLHGCTQSAEDFAIGTGMNALADRHGFLVAYPQQTAQANQAKCWNWFRPEDQQGDAGEPAILAGIARQAARDHRVDLDRIFVAGLSAGAAMAVVLGRTRPDLVRAIGVHSGLPYASAADVPSAFAAMQGRGSAPPRASTATPLPVPMILFHGDEDRTVAPSNADALTAASVRPGLRVTVETGRAAGGKTYARELAVDQAGTRWLERWTVHGAGHAWSGGDPAGSYTEPAGPDASAAMVEFFLRQR
ncbi:MAG TPA: PHB depolymerase family esterase [Pseudoxanthomonas sp.]|nr:PHB depolymerase family esterase [Pseudoxanthomonas sp.]